MGETFTKLFSSITDSTIWSQDNETRLVWITMLAMADQEGYIGASVDGLARRANVPVEATERALTAFLSPDPRSRSQEHEGRRIATAERGWTLLNYKRFREMRDDDIRREGNRLNKQAQREREKLSRTSQQKSSKSSPVSLSRSDQDLDQIPDTEHRSPVYPQEFETVWAKTGERGSKDPAFKVWVKVGRPTWSVIELPYAAYLRSERPMAGERYIQNLSTWLTNRGWEKEWKPAASIRTNPEWVPGTKAKGLVHIPKGG